MGTDHHDMPPTDALAELFGRAVAVPEGERDAWLDEHCPDPAVRRRLEALLAHDAALDDDSGGFLEPRLRVPPADELDTRDGDPREGGTTAGGPADDVDAGVHVPGYRIVGVLGRGGMGTVFEAEQVRPSRTVALKVIRGDLASPALLQRFEHESELLARLEHPGIARVFDAGIAPAADGTGPGRPWFAMELVRGRRLDDWAGQATPSLEDRLEMLARICDALQHAHQKGIVHRDVKPANVLVTEDGQPKVVDFGIARANDEARPTGLETGTGRLIGTLDYMSPEQVAGDVRRVDARSDVYALGVVGYELLTGRRPHATADSSLPDALRAIVETAPERPGRIAPELRGDVETVLLHALEKDPDRRYAAASELAADLRRILASEPITARPPSAVYQLRCFARRHRGLTASAAVAAATVVVALVVVSILAVRLDDALEEARLGRSVAERDSGRAAAVGDFLERTLSAPDPFSDEPATAETPVGELLVRAERWLEGSFEDEPFAEAAARAVLGRTYKGLGQYAEAEAQIAEAIARLDAADERDLLPKDALRRAALHAEHGVVLAYLDRHDEAAAAIDRSNAIAARVEVVPAADAAARLGNVGFVLRELDRTGEAITVMEASMEAARAAGDAGAQQEAAAANNLAGMMLRTGDFERALELYDRAYDLFERTFGPDHPNLLVLSTNIGALAIRTGDFETAARRLRENVRLLEASVGAAHPRTLTAMNNLGYALHEIAAWEEAEAIYLRALDGVVEVYGKDHDEYRGTYRNYAFLLRAIDRHGDAAEAWRFVADAFRDDPTDARHYALVYDCYVIEHELRARAADEVTDGDVAAWREAFARMVAHWGPDASRTKSTLDAIRTGLDELGRAGAIPDFERVVEHADAATD